MTKEGITDDDIEFCLTRQGSSHPRKRTSSVSLWQQRRGRTIKTVIVQSTTGTYEDTAEKSKCDERVLHMTCYIMLVGMSMGSGTIVQLYDSGPLTQSGYDFSPLPAEAGVGERSAVMTVATRTKTDATRSLLASLPAVGRLTRTRATSQMLGNDNAAMEPVMPDLCTIVNEQPVKTTTVIELKKCRVIHIVAEPASYHGFIDLIAEDEVDYRELVAGGYMHGLRRSTLDFLSLGAAELFNVSLHVRHQYNVETGRNSKNDNSPYTHVQRMRAMDDNGVSPKGVDPSLRCRRKLVIAMAFGTGPNPRCRRKPVSATSFGRGSGDLQKTLPFITAEDWAWYIIICYYHDNAMRLPKLPVKNDAILIDNADLPTSMSLDSRAAWEAGLMQLPALGRGCMGVTKRSRWAYIDIGTNRCCLHMTSACPAEALCVHLPSNIYHGWYTIGDNINVVRSRWRLPFTRSYRMSDTCSMMEVGRQNKIICQSGGSRQRLYSMSAFKFPLFANLDEYNTEGPENRAGLMGEAPCGTVVQYYATEFGHGNSNFTFGLLPRGRRRCYHDVQRFLALQRQGWTLNAPGLCQMIHATVVGILTASQDKCNYAWMGTGLPILHQGMGTSCCSAACFLGCGEELYDHIICHHMFLTDGRHSIDLAVKSDPKYCRKTRADRTSSYTVRASLCDLIYNNELCWTLFSHLPHRSATFVLNCGAEPVHDGEHAKSMAATTGSEAARANGYMPTVSVPAMTIDSAITPDDNYCV